MGMGPNKRKKQLLCCRMGPLKRYSPIDERGGKRGRKVIYSIATRGGKEVVCRKT